jgi:hypothetical protein
MTTGLEAIGEGEEPVKALVSWEDAEGVRHRWAIAYDPDDPEARHFLEGLELHARFRLETFNTAEAEGDPTGPERA